MGGLSLQLAAAAAGGGALALVLCLGRWARKRGGQRTTWLSARAAQLGTATATPAYIWEHVMRLGDAYCAAERPDGYICLAISENRLAPPLFAHELVLARPGGLESTGYDNPRGGLRFRLALANFLSTHVAERPVHHDALACSAGATGVLHNLLFAIADAGDVCLIPASLVPAAAMLGLPRSRAPYLFAPFAVLFLTDTRRRRTSQASTATWGTCGLASSHLRCRAPHCPTLTAASGRRCWMRPWRRRRGNIHRAESPCYSLPTRTTPQASSTPSLPSAMLWNGPRAGGCMCSSMRYTPTQCSARARASGRKTSHVAKSRRSCRCVDVYQLVKLLAWHTQSMDFWPHALIPAAPSVPQMYPELPAHVHVCWGMSKIFGIAGWRVGVLVSENTQVAYVFVCVCVCVCACVRACVRVRGCMCVCARAYLLACWFSRRLACCVMMMVISLNASKPRSKQKRSMQEVMIYRITSVT